MADGKWLLFYRVIHLLTRVWDVKTKVFVVSHISKEANLEVPFQVAHQSTIKAQLQQPVVSVNG